MAVECHICNREVAGSNLGLGYFAPRSTQPSIPPGSENKYQLWLRRQRQIWLIPIADECVGVQVKLWNPLRTRAIPERFLWWFTTKRHYIKCMHPYLYTARQSEQNTVSVALVINVMKHTQKKTKDKTGQTEPRLVVALYDIWSGNRSSLCCSSTAHETHTGRRQRVLDES